MKYIHKPIEVEAMKFTRTEAENPDSLAFSQFFIQDRSKTSSWSYWKTPESLTVPGRFFLRTKQHSTMTVCIGDWLVKEVESGHVTIMSEKRFNDLYRAKQPPQEDWREVIKTSGLSYDKIKEAYAKVLPKIVYETSKPSEARYWGTPTHDWLKHTQDGLLGRHLAEQARELDEKIMSQFNEGPPSAIGAIMEAEQSCPYCGNTGIHYCPKKGDIQDAHRTNSTDRETGPADCCNRGTCKGCTNDG